MSAVVVEVHRELPPLADLIEPFGPGLLNRGLHPEPGLDYGLNLRVRVILEHLELLVGLAEGVGPRVNFPLGLQLRRPDLVVVHRHARSLGVLPRDHLE